MCEKHLVFSARGYVFSKMRYALGFMLFGLGFLHLVLCEMGCVTSTAGCVCCVMFYVPRSCHKDEKKRCPIGQWERCCWFL